MADALTIPSVPPAGSTPAPVKTAPTPKPSLGGLESQLTQQTDKAQKDITSYQDSLASVTKDFHEELGQLKSQAPKVPNGDPFKAPDEVNPISAFGSSAGLLAAIMSGFSRAPLTTSLNAMTAGMKAIKDGNSQAYSRAFDEWKTNTDYAFKTFDAQGKAYDRLLDLAKTDYDGAVNGIKQLASMTDDKAMLTANEMKGIEGVEQLHIERQRLGIEAQEAYGKMIPATIFNQSIKEYEVKNGKKPDAHAMQQLWMDAQYGVGSGGTGGGSLQAQIDAIGHYRAKMPPQGRSNPRNQAIADGVFAQYPNYAAEKYDGIQKSWNDFMPGGKDGSLIASGNKAIQHLGLLRDAFDAMHNGNVPLFNEAKLKWQQATGSPLPTNYAAIADVAAGELANFATNGGGGGRGSTLDDRKGMQESIHRSMASGQGKGVFDSYIGLVAGQMDAKRLQYNAAGLDNMQPFDDLLLPEMKTALASRGKKASGDFSHLWDGSK